MSNQIKILFVCLGNICRSPMAEGAFNHLLQGKGLEMKYLCDSAGTSAFHIGEQPDRRMRETALRHGISLNHAAQQLTKEDLNDFDYVVAMDEANKKDIERLMFSGQRAKVLMLREFDEQKDSLNVPDPYYGGADGFEEVYDICTRSCEAFLDYLEEN